MSKLTIVIDDLGHKELEEYLKTVAGINEVEINDDEELEVTIYYDSNITTYKIIRMEVLLFLNIMDFPALLMFDKYAESKLSVYQIIRNGVCCEHCYKSVIDDLFITDGVEKVESNFDGEIHEDNITINVFYDSNKVSIEDIKKIEANL